jgi:kelch-like protein 20
MREKNAITMDVVRDCSPTRPKLNKISDRHAKLLLEQIYQLRRNNSTSNVASSPSSSNNNDLCDVVISVGNSKIKAHKIILSASSPYFRAMFTNELAESKQNEITLKDIDEQAMEMLIEFCYSSKITIDEKSVQTLLPAACLLQMQEIQDYCSEFLRSQLDPSNVLGIRAFADTHSCQDLLKIADKYLQNNFVDCVESDEFLLLPFDQLIDIIARDELNVSKEEQVYLACMKWIKHDLGQRKQHIGQLMLHVRFPLIDTKFLVTKISSDLLIKNDSICRDLIDEAKDYHLMSKEAALVQSSTRIKPRKPVITGEVLLAVGGWCSGDAISYVEMWDPQKSNEWKIVASMSKRRCGVGVGVLGNMIYAICGHDGATYLDSTERYDVVNNQWFSDTAPLTSCRTSVGVGVLEGFLYVIGGQGNKDQFFC